MICKLGRAPVSLALFSGCGDSTPLKNGSSASALSDAATGAGGGQGGSTTGRSQAGQNGGGTSSVEGTVSSPRGGSATGGSSTVKAGTTTGGNSTGGAADSSVRAGTTTIGGSSAITGATTGGSGGTSSGGQTVTTAPASDSPGQDPFTRPAGGGILITSSDGLNGIELYLAADSKGGMFVTGASRNPKAMGLTAFDPGIKSEAFAARLDAQGRLLWSEPLKTCGVPADIAAGPDDTVFVLCPYEPDAASLMPSVCMPTAVVDKLSGTDGKIIFESEIKPPAPLTDTHICPYGLGVDTQGRSYAGGGYAPTSLTTRSILIAVTASGQQDWTLISEGPDSTPTTDFANSYVTDVTVDSNGNVLFVGGFNTWTKWGATQLTSQAKTGQWSSYNGFITRVPASGSGATAWRFGGTVLDIGSSIAPTGDGGFAVGGWASASSSIGGKTVTALEEGSAFVAQLNSAGQASWAKALPGESITDAVAVGPDGKVHFVGRFASDEILYTYDPATDTLTPRKTVAGNATNNEIRTSSVAVSTSGAVWLSGSFKGTINLGTGALSTTTVATFLFKMD